MSVDMPALSEAKSEVEAVQRQGGGPWLSLFGRLAPLVVGVVSLGITFWSASIVEVANLEVGETRFDTRVLRVRTAIEARMAAYEQVLQGGVAFFDASEQVDRSAWSRYVAGLRVGENFPGIQGIGFSVRVTPADTAAHIRQIRAEGFPDYTIWPDGDRPVYTAIIYLEPFDFRNRRAFGFDMMSEPTRRAAMQRARDTGAAAMSGKVILKQETNEDVQAGFLTYLPVYQKGLPVATTEDRRAALLGYVYSPFRMNDLMSGILGPDEIDAALAIHDGPVVSDESLTYTSGDASAAALFTRTVSLDFSGRTWTLVVTSLPNFEANLDLGRSRAVLIAGVVITLLLVAVAWLMANTRAAAQKLAHDMTVSLRKSENEVRALNGDLERRVRLRTGELESANKELETFAYTVSHDLRAPLRSIHGFTDALAEDYADRLDDQGRDYTNRIRAASIRMGQLIDDILKLSRISRAKLVRGRIDLSALATTLIEEVRRGAGEREVTVRIQPGLHADGDETLLRAMLQNLLENAWKFTSKIDKAVIEVGGEEPNETQTFYVRDNGAGFDMQYADKLFKPFQRLHSDSEFQGTGIGLATVARIVARHGGQIWAESEPGRGTTIRFTLSPQS